MAVQNQEANKSFMNKNVTFTTCFKGIPKSVIDIGSFLTLPLNKNTSQLFNFPTCTSHINK